MIYFCRPCREPLDTAECPFCDNDATPFDEICDRASGIEAATAGETAKQGSTRSAKARPEGDAQPQEPIA